MLAGGGGGCAGGGGGGGSNLALCLEPFVQQVHLLRTSCIVLALQEQGVPEIVPNINKVHPKARTAF